MGNELANDTVDAPESDALAEIAKSDDASLYIEQRREDEATSKEIDEAPDLADAVQVAEKKKLSRNERRRAAREALERENADLRAKIEPTERSEAPPTYDREKSDLGVLENSLQFAHDKHGEKFIAAYEAFTNHVRQSGDQATYNKIMASADIGDALVEWYDQGAQAQQAEEPVDPYQAALEQGRQHTNFEAALAEREQQIRVQTEARFRAEQFAQAYPDFQETVAGVADIETIPAPMLEMIKRSEFGPAIAYWLAKDATEGQGLIWDLADLDGNTHGQAMLVGRMEQMVRNGFNQTSAPPRATKAPPPIKPIQGGSDGPKDIHSLAKNDDISAYAKARGRG
jgi:hypothetical protein